MQVSRPEIRARSPSTTQIEFLKVSEEVVFLQGLTPWHVGSEQGHVEYREDCAQKFIIYFAACNSIELLSWR